ncbi:MAG: ectonucleotide pyrophosphatase/phosphodiesterase [candidate division KSB1 bacterium]|nr:ectonucleotide pyrophosphatase/phosphodiesterase [candidate division KSB1 bacterium]MDZ7275753.1 ectonucleotide pyrophosphatase/phosphodiesterase [candidate division KSB1 bacterium]MDZ7284556.1 ectonucleotide pyrophosphatase/phosphodiesterase [candidate division KSB1 bacterium]MDZ7298025.1 ectonucleotide pyrophosphatase/phosphodiesterase [candidate division KSB1 bacterium]MDZ7348890.1 ectonucleotide pyrophosphatase/phosphodiesterase [candidate division KSB1 bacterium]
MQLKRLAVLAGLILAGGIRPAAAQEAVGPGNRITDLAPTVILISIDGFRHDYLDRAAAPNLQRLARNGVRAHGMIPAFPSKTFPNHYTLVTGLYPEHHGIVSNTMLDPEGKARFRISDRAAVEDSRWWGGEPLWVTAQKQGQLTATYFWVGSEAEILGTRPAYWKRYAHNTPNRARVAQVLAWLDLPKPQRPTLITLYFSTVDEAGHEFGPDSPEVMQAVAAIDTVIGTLLEGLAARDIFQQVNLIIVSDHGMAATSAGRVIHLDDYLDLQQVDVIDWTPVLALLPRPGEEEAVYQKLKGAHPHLQVYRKAEVPERFHFRGHRRIMPIIGLADEGWTISTRGRNRRPRGGDHGYDNLLPSMRATFIAHGPAFKSQLQVAPFQNIHVYNLACEILHLVPAPNDGSLDSVRTMLK